MGLNKSKGNMYEWITHTWNPLAGECPHGCSYCSTNKLMRYPGIRNKYTGPPRIHELEMKTNLGKGNFIFVVAQNDLFAKNIPDEFIKQILDHCNKFDNSYLFQTKNPENIRRILIPNSSVCVTLESNRFYPEIMRNSPKPIHRVQQMELIRHPLYITIEPIMDFDLSVFIEMIEGCVPRQVNIGADSGNNNLPEPSKEKILTLISELEKFTKVKQKSNLKRLL
jgi:protein gp37